MIKYILILSSCTNEKQIGKKLLTTGNFSEFLNISMLVHELPVIECFWQNWESWRRLIWPRVIPWINRAHFINITLYHVIMSQFIMIIDYEFLPSFCGKGWPIWAWIRENNNFIGFEFKAACIVFVGDQQTIFESLNSVVIECTSSWHINDDTFWI